MGMPACDAGVVRVEVQFGAEWTPLTADANNKPCRAEGASLHEAAPTGIRAAHRRKSTRLAGARATPVAVGSRQRNNSGSVPPT